MEFLHQNSRKISKLGTWNQKYCLWLSPELFRIPQYVRNHSFLCRNMCCTSRSRLYIHIPIFFVRWIFKITRLYHNSGVCEQLYKFISFKKKVASFDIRLMMMAPRVVDTYIKLIKSCNELAKFTCITVQEHEWLYFEFYSGFVPLTPESLHGSSKSYISGQKAIYKILLKVHLRVTIHFIEILDELKFNASKIYCTG